MSDPPPDSVCIFPGCRKPPTHESITGIIEGAPDINGVPDPDGFTWQVEWVCEDHR